MNNFDATEKQFYLPQLIKIFPTEFNWMAWKIYILYLILLVYRNENDWENWAEFEYYFYIYITGPGYDMVWNECAPSNIDKFMKFMVNLTAQHVSLFMQEWKETNKKSDFHLILAASMQ